MNEDEKARIAAALGASKVVDLKPDERVRVIVDALNAAPDNPEMVALSSFHAAAAIAALEHAGYYVGRLEEVPPVWCSKHEKTLHPGPDEWGRPWRSEDHDPCPLFRKVVP